MHAHADVVALERNMWSMFRVLGSGEGGRVIDEPARLIVTSPLMQPPYNGVWRFHSDGRPLGEQVAEILGPMKARGAPVVWIVHPTVPDGLRAALTEAGLERVEELFGMCADLAGLEAVPPVPDGVDVIEGTGAEQDADAWLYLVTWRYGLDRSASPYLKEIYGKAIGHHTRLWLAMIDGEPVSKAGMHIDADGVAGIYAVATTDNGRRRGLAKLLTLSALHAARAQGVVRAVLHSTPMAIELYRRLGFRDVATFEVWAEPGKLHLS